MPGGASGAPGPEVLATIKIVCDAPKNSEAVGSSNANSLCGGEFGWITGNLCISKGYFATTCLTPSLTCPAMQSGLCRPSQVCTAAVQIGDVDHGPAELCVHADALDVDDARPAIGEYRFTPLCVPRTPSLMIT
jgi:hypothetical protein